MTTSNATTADPAANPTVPALLRHFTDLRDGRHGVAAVSRADKEALFAEEVELLAPYAVQVLEEINQGLLRDTGTVCGTGVVRQPGSGVAAHWTLSWPEQRAAHLQPITLTAHYGTGFHHPHLRGATVGEWPLNVFDAEQAAAELPTLRAIASADLHNLVFQRDYRIVPEMTAGRGGA